MSRFISSSGETHPFDRSHVEKIERQERAETRRRQSGKNRDGMEEALVENAENDINHQDGHHEQHAKSRQRRLKSLRIALKRGRGCRRQSMPRQIIDFVDGVSDRCARL